MTCIKLEPSAPGSLGGFICTRGGRPTGVHPRPRWWPWNDPLRAWLRRGRAGDDVGARAWAAVPVPDWLVRIAAAAEVPRGPLIFATAEAARRLLALEGDAERRGRLEWVHRQVERAALGGPGAPRAGFEKRIEEHLRGCAAMPTAAVLRLVRACDPPERQPWRAEVECADAMRVAARAGYAGSSCATLREHLPWSLWGAQIARAIEGARGAADEDAATRARDGGPDASQASGAAGVRAWLSSARPRP